MWITHISIIFYRKYSIMIKSPNDCFYAKIMPETGEYPLSICVHASTEHVGWDKEHIGKMHTDIFAILSNSDFFNVQYIHHPLPLFLCAYKSFCCRVGGRQMERTGQKNWKCNIRVNLREKKRMSGLMMEIFFLFLCIRAHAATGAVYARFDWIILSKSYMAFVCI